MNCNCQRHLVLTFQFLEFHHRDQNAMMPLCVHSTSPSLLSHHKQIPLSRRQRSKTHLEGRQKGKENKNKFHHTDVNLDSSSKSGKKWTEGVKLYMCSGMNETTYMLRKEELKKSLICVQPHLRDQPYWGWGLCYQESKKLPSLNIRELRSPPSILKKTRFSISRKITILGGESHLIC